VNPHLTLNSDFCSGKFSPLHVKIYLGVCGWFIGDGSVTSTICAYLQLLKTC